MFDATQNNSARERIRDWRKRAGLSMAKAAKLAGLGSASAWQYYEHNFDGDEIPRFIRVVMGLSQADVPGDEYDRLCGRLRAIAGLIDLRATTSLTDAEVLRMISEIVKEEAK